MHQDHSEKIASSSKERGSEAQIVIKFQIVFVKIASMRLNVNFWFPPVHSRKRKRGQRHDPSRAFIKTADKLIEVDTQIKADTLTLQGKTKSIRKNHFILSYVPLWLKISRNKTNSSCDKNNTCLIFPS
jgi:hypothetical protein